MKTIARTASVVAILAVAMLGTACAQPAPEVRLSGQVKAVVDRTKTTQETYAQYSWNEIVADGRTIQEWAAEFHSGDKHRVETPRDRVIADCRAQTGIALSLVTGKTVEGPMVARSACGINTNKAFTSAEWQGLVRTRFGPADRVRLADKDVVRTYDISPTGVILRTTYVDGADRRLVLSSEAVGVLPQLPASDIFDKASLARSYVPERFKTAPDSGS